MGTRTCAKKASLLSIQSRSNPFALHPFFYLDLLFLSFLLPEGAAAVAGGSSEEATSRPSTRGGLVGAGFFLLASDSCPAKGSNLLASSAIHLARLFRWAAADALLLLPLVPPAARAAPAKTLYPRPVSHGFIMHAESTSYMRANITCHLDLGLDHAHVAAPQNTLLLPIRVHKFGIVTPCKLHVVSDKHEVWG